MDLANEGARYVEIIAVHGLGKTFAAKQKEPGIAGSVKAVLSPRFKDVEAVRNVSFSIDEGEAIAFIGANGAGKSTKVLLHPTTGEAVVLGIVPWRDRQQISRKIGTVFRQRYRL